ncbi:Uncharacterised protein [uncultured archaeon]|nr:Uncharacterised protein [uncultured archaeon]
MFGIYLSDISLINSLPDLRDPGTPDMYSCYDAFVYDFESKGIQVPPNSTTTEMYYTLMNNMTETSRSIMQKTGRPSFVLLSTTPGPLWDKYNDTYGFMRYAYKNQSILVNAGIFGIMYKNWSGPGQTPLVQDTTNALGAVTAPKDDKFCGFEQATNMYLSPLDRKTVFLRMDAKANFTDMGGMPISAPQCVECNPLEKSNGMCSHVCLNLVNGSGGIAVPINCTLDPTIANDSQRCPMEPVDSVNNKCVLCTDLVNVSKYNKVIECNRTELDGSKTSLTINDPTMVLSYPDAIAVLPPGQKCCFAGNENESNHTYTAMTADSLSVTPVLYPRSGDPNVDCGLASGSGTFCGFDMPVRNYKLECAVTP